MDLAFAKARETDPDLIIANDPDADRCAVAVRDQESGRRRLADAARRRGRRPARHPPGQPRSPAAPSPSPSCPPPCSAGSRRRPGLPYEETLTGFKWIARVEGLRYGYEEALGYCVDPDGVRDKDGITAALLITELASGLKEEGRTLLDLLDDIARRARSARHRPALGPGRGPVPDRRRDAAPARAAARRSWRACRSPAPTTSPGARTGCRPPTACATPSTAPGSSSAPAAPSRS